MRHTSRLKNFIWYSLVGLLVTVAVLVSVVRLTIGAVSEYRQHLENMAGDYLGKPVAITSMDARLVGINPTVVLDDISLLDELTKEPLAHFSSIRIALNPVSSLRQLRPVIDLSIYGANMVVGLREDGTLQVQGVAISPQENSRSSSALGAWLLSQSRLVLKQSTLVWRNWSTGEEAVFVGGELELVNLQNRHRLSGYVQLPSELGKELQLAVDIHGDLLTQKDWLGEFYVKAVEVQPAAMLQRFDYMGLQLQQGQVDLELWSRWQGGLLEGLEGTFNLADVTVSRADDAIHLARLAAEVRYASGDEGWHLQLQRLQIEHEDLPDEQLALDLKKNEAGTVIQLSALPLALLQRYAPFLPVLEAPQRELIAQSAPSGRLNDVRLEFDEAGVVRAVAELESLQFSSWQRYPGLSGLSGRFAMDNDAAELAIDSENLVLTWPHTLRQPAVLQTARGSILLNKQDEQWRITGDRLQIANQDVQSVLSFDSWITPGESPLISLETEFKNGRAAAVPGYLPEQLMSGASGAWIDKALVDGRIASGHLLLHGRLNAFPYRQQQGHFEVELDARDVTLHYQEGWPDLHQVSGEVRISGTGLSVDARHATVYSSRLQKTSATIADFRRPLLQVEGTADASLADTLHFVRESPLLNQGRESLKQLQAGGNTQIALALAIPLSKSVARRSPLTVIGRTALKGASLRVADGVQLSELEGDLLFTETGFEAQSIKGRLYDAPFKLQVFTEQAGEHRQVVIAGQGGASARAMQRELNIAFLERLEGATEWQSRVTIPYGGEGSSRLDVHSSLQGMAIDLPQPAAKARDEIRPLSVTWQLGSEKTRIHRLNYGELASALWQQENTPFKLLGASVSFGAGSEPDLLKPGIMKIKGSLANLAFREWDALRKELLAGAEGGTPLPIELEMQRLHLLPSTKEVADEGKALHVKDVPPIRALIRNFRHGDLALGQVDVMLRPQDGKLLLDKVNVTAPSFTLVGKGEWVESDKTRLELRLSSGDFGQMMRELGFASVITGGKTTATGQLHWPGHPAAFKTSHLAGQVHVKIEEGRMEEVNAGAGKLLGLFSLQALPRRLLLDFRDLSGKGLQFTTLEGDIRLSEGSAFTQNLHIESLPANILISGRTGLVDRDFDQLITVVPNVSDTVSIAGGLAWGPQAAAVLLVLQKVFQSDIDAAAMTRYHLQGSWDEPKLTTLTDGQ